MAQAIWSGSGIVEPKRGAMGIVGDSRLNRAVRSISLNAGQANTELLRQTLVDTGLLAELENPNSEVISGRRGTGKTHVLRVLTDQLNREMNVAAIYLDARRLGSTGLTDSSKRLAIFSVPLFRDLLSHLQSGLRDLAMDASHPERAEALESVDALAEVVAQFPASVSAREVTTESARAAERSRDVAASISSRPALGVRFSSSALDTTKMAERYTLVFDDSLSFPEIADALERVLLDLKITRLYLVIDEWSEIPLDVQPYIADFLKHTVLPTTQVTLKIGTLAHGSAFSAVRRLGHRIGLEINGDISRGADLGERYSFLNEPKLLTDVYTEILWQHVMANIEEDNYLRERFSILSAGRLRTSVFSDDAAFAELIKASGGNVRDFLYIFRQAYFRAQAGRSDVIGIEAIRYAARASFQHERWLNLDLSQKRAVRDKGLM
jgi:hypothetical protein